MELVFNELSVAKTQHESHAQQLYKQFYETTIHADMTKCSFVHESKITVIKEGAIADICLFPDFSFKQWLSRLPLTELNKKRKFFRMIGTFQSPVIYPEYSYKKKEALGLGYAFKNNLLAISFETSAQWNKWWVEIESLTIENSRFETKKCLKVKHLSAIKHLKYHQRTFRHHTKHNRHNPAKDESPLLYNPENKTDLQHIRDLLNCAIPVRKGSNRLCFYDKNHKKYIVFYRESKDKNSLNYNYFHGFHIKENDRLIPQKTKNAISLMLQKTDN